MVLINRSLDEGIFSTRLKESKLFPLFKGGDPTVIDNYRPINLLPIFSIIYEKLTAKNCMNTLKLIKFFLINNVGFGKQIH